MGNARTFLSKGQKNIGTGGLQRPPSPLGWNGFKQEHTSIEANYLTKKEEKTEKKTIEQTRIYVDNQTNKYTDRIVIVFNMTQKY